jgi:hypothetical protein
VTNFHGIRFFIGNGRSYRQTAATIIGKMKTEQNKRQFNRADQVPHPGLMVRAIIFIGLSARFLVHTGQRGLKAPTMSHGNRRDNTMSHSPTALLPAFRPSACDYADHANS